MRKWIRRLFVVGVILLLLVVLAKTVLRPKDMNYYENRYADKLPALTLSAFLDGSYQDGVEAALMDQAPLAQRGKKLYNDVNTRFLYDGVQRIFSEASRRYVSYQKVELYGDSIVFPPYVFSDLIDKLDAKAENYNACFAAHPELSFRVFFIEKDTDINFETGEKLGASDYLLQALTLPAQDKAIYRVNSYDEFAQNFYRTDHHWCCEGSYLGYQEVMTLLGRDCEIAAGEKTLVRPSFTGSKALTSGAQEVFSEPFYAYPYAYPPMEVTINGESAEDYGAQSAYLKGGGSSISYGYYYGSDSGEVILKNLSGGSGKALVIGDSFDNAILKLLAASYAETYSIDLRYYEVAMGQPFSFSAYVAAHGIDTVLFIGNVDFYTMPEFMVEG